MVRCSENLWNSEEAYLFSLIYIYAHIQYQTTADAFSHTRTYWISLAAQSEDNVNTKMGYDAVTCFDIIHILIQS